MRRIHGNRLAVAQIQRSPHNLRQPRFRLDVYRVRLRYRPSRAVVDCRANARRVNARRLDVLHQRSRAEHIQRLQSVADAEHGLLRFVGILQNQLVHHFPLGIGGSSLFVAIRAVLLRIDIRAAAGQQNGVAALKLLHHLSRSLIQVDAHRLSTRSAYGFFVLGQRALGVLAISGMRHGNGNARHGGFQFGHD